MPMSGYDVYGLSRCLCGAMQTIQIVLKRQIILHDIPVTCEGVLRQSNSGIIMVKEVTEV